MIGPWTSLSVPEPFDMRLPVRISLAVGMVLLAIGCVLAWRNFQLGKKRSAGIPSACLHLSFSLRLAAWPFTTSWAPDASEIVAIFNQLGRALLAGSILWTGYVAVEPYVRRRWPQSLIAPGAACGREDSAIP
jgi:hypothetical protein